MTTTYDVSVIPQKGPPWDASASGSYGTPEEAQEAMREFQQRFGSNGRYALRLSTPVKVQTLVPFKEDADPATILERATAAHNEMIGEVRA